MGSKVMITYKRKRVTSRAHTADDTVRDSSSAASSNVVISTLTPKYEAHAENNMVDEDDFPTSTKQQGVCKLRQQNIKEELQLCESLPRKEEPEICCATILSIAEAHSNKLRCIDDTNNPIHVSSSVCDPMHIDRMTNRTEDSNTSALAEINYRQAPKNPIRPDQCKNRFSPLLTFRRRVKKKISSDELAEENCSPDNNKQYSTLTCSPPSSSPVVTPLLKCTGGKSLDIEDKEATVGRSTGVSMQAEHSLEQESLHVVKSSVQHMFPSEIAEAVNQNVTLEHDGTPVSKFTGVQEVSEQDARVEDLSKTSPGSIEVPKVIDVNGEGHANGQTSSLPSSRQEINISWLKSTNKSAAEDLLESQGSTKNVPIIVLDDDSDEKGKELENSEVLDPGGHHKNKSRFSLGKIDLNCAELRQEGPLCLDDSSIQWLPCQDQFGNARKQMSQPIERMFFSYEKDTVHGKQQQHEGSSTIHTSYSNCFDLTPQWNTGNFSAQRSLPSELKFRMMDKVPEFNLDLSLDSFPDSSVSARRSNKFFLGGTSSVSHKLTEKLGTYSYKRHSAPWSEEEIDFLWIGVRRYGVNDWNAMLRDTRLRFSNSRMPDDLAKQWDKEQKKLLGAGILQSIRTSALGPAPPPHIAEDYLGRGSCSGCSKSPFLAAQTDLSLGDVYLQNARGSERGEHHLSSLGMLNLHGIDSGPRNLCLGGFPVASSSYGRSAGRRRRTSKFHKSYYNNKGPWFPEQAERAPPGHPADPSRDSLRAPSLFSDDVKPHVLPDDASLKLTTRRNADWRSFSKRLFRTDDALDLNQGAAANLKGDTGASSEETVSDS